MQTLKILILLIFSALQPIVATSQHPVTWNSLPSLPDKEGFAGMFAGTVGGALFCMGGANFPDKRPWEGGIKKWYSNLYRLEKNGDWIILPDKLLLPLAYGVSVSLAERIILIGGSSNNVHSNRVIALSWRNNSIHQEELPSLPVPLANMAGSNINTLIIVAGGSSGPATPVLKKVYALDTQKMEQGWFELPGWPGPERNNAVSAVIGDTFYLFSGEKVGINAVNEKYRYILQDAYALVVKKRKGQWTSSWKTIAPLPQGAAAAGSPLPVLKDGTILVSGGVDAVTSLHTTAETHPGINKMIQRYNPKDNSWQLYRNPDPNPARVTLPVVYWNDQWVFVSGEIKPGVRTNTIVSINP